MTRHLLICLTFAGCRFLGPATPEVSPERPGILSTGGSADPSRQPAQFPARRCVVDCGVGLHCDERTAECVPDSVPARRDAGPAWLP